MGKIASINGWWFVVIGTIVFITSNYLVEGLEFFVYVSFVFLGYGAIKLAYYHFRNKSHKSQKDKKGSHGKDHHSPGSHSQHSHSQGGQAKHGAHAHHQGHGHGAQNHLAIHHKTHHGTHHNKGHGHHQPLYCRRCGKQVAITDHFCSGCGQKIHQ